MVRDEDRGSQTLNSPLKAFDKGNIADVINGITTDPQSRFTLSSKLPGEKRYDVFAKLAGKQVSIATIMLNGPKYLASFGVMPARDFENDEKTRKEAEYMLGYLNKVLTFYA